MTNYRTTSAIAAFLDSQRKLGPTDKTIEGYDWALDILAKRFPEGLPSDAARRRE